MMLGAAGLANPETKREEKKVIHRVEDVSLSFWSFFLQSKNMKLII